MQTTFAKVIFFISSSMNSYKTDSINLDKGLITYYYLYKQSIRDSEFKAIENDQIRVGNNCMQIS